LKKRLGLDDGDVRLLMGAVVEAEKDYLKWLYGYEELELEGCDEWTLERLKRAQVFGFFVNATLGSGLDESVKLKVVKELWGSLDLDKFELLLAIHFQTIQVSKVREYDSLLTDQISIFNVVCEEKDSYMKKHFAAIRESHV
jgi:hypothetical protein